MKLPCPECSEQVEARRSELEANYAGAMVCSGYQVKLGPEHRPLCPHWRKK